MSFSIYSFLMAVLWSSVFVLLLCLCRRSRNLIVCLGVWPLLGVIVCTLARCFFPLEMLSFTHVVMGSELVTRVDDFLTSPVPGLAVTPLQFGFSARCSSSSDSSGLTANSENFCTRLHHWKKMTVPRMEKRRPWLNRWACPGSPST